MAVTPLTSCEHYNGDTWSSGGNLNTARHTSRSNGIQTAAISTGGDLSSGITVTCENYDGTCWASGTSFSTSRYGHGAGGTSTSSFITAGYTGSVTTNTTEEYTEAVTARTISNS